MGEFHLLMRRILRILLSDTEKKKRQIIEQITINNRHNPQKNKCKYNIKINKKIGNKIKEKIFQESTIKQSRKLYISFT